jgi:hypothetical protein
MHVHRQSRRLALGLRVCAVTVGLAASAVSSCSKTKTPVTTPPVVVPDSGVIAGTVSSSQGGPLVVDVTATDANKDGFTVNTDSSGNYLIPNVPAGSGTITVSLLPSNCTTPAAGDYTLGRGDTITVLITVACTP